MGMHIQHIAPAALDFIRADYLRPGAPSFAACYRRLRHTARQQRWALPCERTLRRHVAQLPAPVVMLHRQGAEALVADIEARGLERLAQLVAAAFGVDLAELRGQRRRHALAPARQGFFLLATRLTGNPYAVIGACLNRHAMRAAIGTDRAREREAADPDYGATLAAIADSWRATS